MTHSIHKRHDKKFILMPKRLYFVYTANKFYEMRNMARADVCKASSTRVHTYTSAKLP